MNTELEKIDSMLDATKNIIHILHPLSDRAKKRIITYFYDLCSDPENGGFQETEIIKRVSELLGVKEIS